MDFLISNTYKSNIILVLFIYVLMENIFYIGFEDKFMWLLSTLVWESIFKSQMDVLLKIKSYYKRKMSVMVTIDEN